jgi:hypothetical protein
LICPDGTANRLICPDGTANRLICPDGTANPQLARQKKGSGRQNSAIFSQTFENTMQDEKLRATGVRADAWPFQRSRFKVSACICPDPFGAYPGFDPRKSLILSCEGLRRLMSLAISKFVAFILSDDFTGVETKVPNTKEGNAVVLDLIKWPEMRIAFSLSPWIYD